MFRGLVTVFPISIRQQMRKIDWNGLEEIRVRLGWPVELIYGNYNSWVGNYDSMINRQQLDEMLNYITGYSIYAMDEKIKQGYITISGGHRIGITGHVYHEISSDMKEQKITNITEIGGLNIRIARERKGCAKEIVPHLKNGNSIYNTVFFSAPGVGKTTYLRDTIRILSGGDQGIGCFQDGLKVSVIDERSEIAACVNGRPQTDLGKRTDILDDCPKGVGMRMVLRTMSPEVIAVDEIGNEEEFTLLDKMRCSGVKILGTIHAGNVSEVLQNPMIRDCVTSGAIERFVELIRMENGQRTYRIYDGQGNCLCGKL